MIVVMFTEPIGNTITQLFGLELPWGRWPWTIHSAGWGIFANPLVCVPVSLARKGPALGAQAGEKRLSEVVVAGGGFSRFRRATETPFNIILEARP